ncbi:MAG TPA: Mpo1-like protein [Casimicrobiaceae bacterium]
MGRADTLLDRYGAHHRNPVNKAVHWVCVPLIVWSIMGLVWSASPVTANVAIAAALVFYIWLSVSLALGMAALLLAMLYTFTWIGERALVISAVVFVAAWIGQFIGHAIERSRPSLLEDLRSFLIAPAWLLAFVYRRLGIPY